jgi:predicted nucleotidyltransferase
LDRAEALAKAKAFAALAKPLFHPEQILLYGSFARGEEKEDSDVDVAVVVKSWTSSILDAQSELFRLSHDIDLRIEPILLEEAHDRSGFLASIRKYAIEVT